MNSSLQIAGHLGRNNPLAHGRENDLGCRPSTGSPWTTQECTADTWQMSRGKLCDSSERRQRSDGLQRRIPERLARYSGNVGGSPRNAGATVGPPTGPRKGLHPQHLPCGDK